MDYIYLDNASTSFPKAPTVATAMSDYITNRGININRGSYALAYDVEDINLYNKTTTTYLIQRPGSSTCHLHKC